MYDLSILLLRSIGVNGTVNCVCEWRPPSQIRPSCLSRSAAARRIERRMERMPSQWAFWGTCKRGSAVAVYGYAHYGETLLGLHRPIIICSNSLNGDEKSLALNLKRMRARFGADRVFLMREKWFKGNDRRLVPEVDAVLAAHNVTPSIAPWERTSPHGRFQNSN